MTIIGIFIVIVIFLFLLRSIMKDNDLLILSLCFFFIPFSGVSLYNIADLSFYVLPFTMSACLWILYNLVKLTFSNNSISINLGNSFVILILLFIVIIALSMISPVFINGTDGFLGANDQSNNYYPIVPTTILFLQFLYIFIGGIFSIFVIGFLKDFSKLEILLKVILISGVIACVIGLLELLAFYVGIDYPTGWYHTVPTGNSDEKGVRLDGLLNIARINSVSYETSNFSQHMLVQYALLYYCRSKNVVIFSKVKDRYILWLILTSLILALSSTAIFGLFIIHTLYWLFSAWSLKKILKLSVFLVVIGLFTFVLYSKFEIIAQALDAFVFNKFISGSFESRLGAGYSAAEVFLRHPLIGVGFGILPPADLILVILVGSGVLGGFVFLAMIIVVTYNGYRNPVKFGRFHNSTNILNKANQRIVIISNALTFSFIILIIIYQATGFSFRFGDFWSLAALVVAASNIRDKIV
jgi:hypothetical protein